MVLGVDPGSAMPLGPDGHALRWTAVGALHGVALLEMGGTRPFFVAADHLPADAILPWAAKYGTVELVAIETPLQPHEQGGSRGTSIARNIARTNKSVGRLMVLAEQAKIRVDEIEANVARRAFGAPSASRAKRLVASPTGGVQTKRVTTDAILLTHVRLKIDEWPIRTANHERDAAIVACAAWKFLQNPGLRPVPRAPQPKVRPKGRR